MRPEERAAREDGRPGYHDPTRALGGTPALSPLGLRLKLAVFGLAVSLVGFVLFAFALDLWPIAIAFLAIAVTSVVDLVVIQRRRRRGEPA